MNPDPQQREPRAPTARGPVQTLVRATATAAAAGLVACGGGGGGAVTDPVVASVSVNPLGAGTAVITIQGSALGQGLTVRAPSCDALARSEAAPLASSDTTAYWRCTLRAGSTAVLNVVVARSRDGATLGGASLDPAASATVASVQTSEPRYGQTLTITLSGSHVNQGLRVEAAGCDGMQLSVSPPRISSDGTAHYQCRLVAVGPNQVVVAPANDAENPLATASFEVPLPQVTLDLRRDNASLGSLVLTLAPVQAPLTVDNFLNYVNTGFYDGTVFHRVVNRPTPFVIQGGGFSGVSTGLELPKPTNPPIALEVNRGLSNVRLSVAMARTASANSATSQFFINLADNLFLDPHAPSPGDPGLGYAVFGSVTEGAAVVNTVATSACTPITGFSECVPIPNVVIASARQTR